MMTKTNPEMIQTAIAEILETSQMTQTTIRHAEDTIPGKEFQETIPMNQTEMTHADAEIPNQDFLIHYGVLGMKWGVRKDRRSSSGSTRKKISSGVKKVQSSLSNAKKASQKRKTTKARVKQKKLDKKTNNPKKMSDAELNKRIERLELEKKYKNLKSADLSKGKKVLENILSKSAENIGTQVTTYLMGEAVNKAFREIMKQAGKETKQNIVNPRKGQKDK